MKIALIGGSSQVGFSLALYLRTYHSEISIISFVRSKYSYRFMNNIGFECEIINFEEDSGDLFKGFDLVLDFTYPSGQIFEIKSKINNNISFVINNMDKGALYIYMSSIMAFGTATDEIDIKNKIVPRSSYAYLKRLAEKRVSDMSKKHGVIGVSFRLGQVHGFLQSVTNQMLNDIAVHDKIRVRGNNNDLTNTVFIDTICKSIFEVFKLSKYDKVKEVYTVVSTPQWSLDDLYYYYSLQCKKNVELICFSKTVNKNRGGLIWNLLSKYRFIFENYILVHLPSLALLSKGIYREYQSNSNSIQMFKMNYDFHLLGTPPIACVPNVVSNNIEKTLIQENNLLSIYQELISKS